MTKELIIGNKKYKQILEYQNFELNSLSYKKALQNDKRNFWQFYISSIKINNLFFFSFLPVKIII